jgi:CPA2 family monovalent cation:H+ antiporter-2
MSTFITKESNIAGSLKELRLREEMGINIAFIKKRR